MAKKQLTPREIVTRHEENVRASLQTCGLRQRLFVHFPKRTRLPLFGRIGVWLVNRTGGIIATKYEFTGDTINSKVRPKK